MRIHGRQQASISDTLSGVLHWSIFSFSNPPSTSTNSASSRTLTRLTGGSTLASAVLALSRACDKSGTSCGGSGAAAEEVDRAVDGMRSARKSGQIVRLGTRKSRVNALCCEMTKSRAVTEISSGLMSKRSFVL